MSSATHIALTGTGRRGRAERMLAIGRHLSSLALHLAARNPSRGPAGPARRGSGGMRLPSSPFSLRLAALLGLCALSLPMARAHVPEAAYLHLQAGETAGLDGELAVRLSDLDRVLRLDADGDGDISGAEIEAREADILQYLGAGVTLRADGRPVDPQMDRLLHGSQHGERFIVAPVVVDTEAPVREVEVGYGLLFEEFPSHQGQIRVTWPDGRVSRASAAQDAGPVVLAWDAAPAQTVPRYLGEGLLDVWAGPDHLLFLLLLLVPTVYRRTPVGRRPVSAAGEAGRAAAVVTAVFVVAGAAGLTAAARDWVHPSSHWVETIIALSVLIAAVFVLLPRAAGALGAWLALVFAPLHGIGLAGHLAGMTPSGAPPAFAAVAYGLGAGLALALTAAVFFAVACALREHAAYRVGVSRVAPVLAICAALYWLFERSHGH